MPRRAPEYESDLRQGVDYLDILGVDETASAEEVVSAFRAKVRAVHPDLNSGAHDSETVARIVRARKTLTGPDREAYLQARRVRRQAPVPTSPEPRPRDAHSRRPPEAAGGRAARRPAGVGAFQRAIHEVRRQAAEDARRGAGTQAPEVAPGAFRRALHEVMGHAGAGRAPRPDGTRSHSSSS